MEDKTKVIIAGAGIAGPVLAIFLTLKGYNPIVYERIDTLADSGLSLCLQPNGLRVLSLIPGFIDKIVGKPFERIAHYSILGDEETVLVDAGFPAKLPELTGFSMMGARRPVFNRTIVEYAESYGVKIIWGHQLIALEQGKEEVKVTFANGASDTASFVIGCDGLHSSTRVCLFGQEQVSFTGLTQTGGISPTPEVFGKVPTMRNFYADGAHLICYPVTDTLTSWAITQREPEAKETWRSMDEIRQNAFKKSPFSEWGLGAGEIVQSADTIVKYGLYDRPELKTWHKGRVVLLGDAAHPTSPHLGQGANQAFEDVYHLVRLLVQHNPSAAAPSTALLSTIFAGYESIRIARASTLVMGARKQGETRVVRGIDACKQRNDALRVAWEDEDAVLAAFLDTYSHPFTGQSEI
ncbi:uncharacterized protein FIBRA_01863 [Fibroporia radiculosa]|uniref:FAD-binding domain-containing protein n=1 Tax=Fibroporia radiculosa TaxID=599839 RepID=J4H1H8_9APHY|nr:uncharacterized protein FIBRA_01863 [Fibroporia radiculosa]CCL99839.1 predicted protein [Fibroporia radiculosa]